MGCWQQTTRRLQRRKCWTCCARLGYVQSELIAAARSRVFASARSARDHALQAGPPEASCIYFDNAIDLEARNCERNHAFLALELEPLARRCIGRVERDGRSGVSCRHRAAHLYIGNSRNMLGIAVNQMHQSPVLIWLFDDIRDHVIRPLYLKRNVTTRRPYNRID